MAKRVDLRPIGNRVAVAHATTWIRHLLIAISQVPADRGLLLVASDDGESSLTSVEVTPRNGLAADGSDAGMNDSQDPQWLCDGKAEARRREVHAQCPPRYVSYAVSAADRAAFVAELESLIA